MFITFIPNSPTINVQFYIYVSHAVYYENTILLNIPIYLIAVTLQIKEPKRAAHTRDAFTLKLGAS